MDVLINLFVNGISTGMLIFVSIRSFTYFWFNERFKLCTRWFCLHGEHLQVFGYLI